MTPGDHGARASLERAGLVAVAIAVSFLRIPYLFSTIKSPDNLDWSWIVNNAEAVRRGAVFGTTYIWTYGPLGFVDQPIALNRPLLLFSDLVQVAVALGLASLALLGASGLMKWKGAASALGTVLLLLPAKLTTGDVEFPLLVGAAMMLVWEGDVSRRWRLPLVGGAGALLACAVLVKSNQLGPAAVLTVAWCASAIVRRRFRAVAVFLGALAFAWLMPFVGFAGGVQAAIRWPASVLPLTLGYGAMALAGPADYLTVALLMSAAFVALIVGALWRDWRVGPKGWLVPTACSLWFVAFKEGFVRESGHVGAFFSVAPWPMLLVCLWATGRGERSGRFAAWLWWGVALASAGALVPTLSRSLPPPGAVAARVRRASEAWSFIVGDRAESDGGPLRGRDLAQEFPGLARLTPTIAGHSAFAWPWDGNAVLVARAREVAPPVPQEYAAYEPSLDDKDAAFLASAGRPGFALVTPEAIDGRLPLQTAPATFRMLLRCYSPVEVSGIFVEARSRPCVGGGIERVGRVAHVKLGAWASLPQSPGALVYARTTLNPSPLGSLLGILFRPAPAYLHVMTADGAVHTYRLVTATSPEGVLVSTLLSTPWDLYRLWQGIAPEQGAKVSVTAVDPAQWESTVAVQFVATSVVPGDAGVVAPLVSAVQRCLPPSERRGTTEALDVMVGVYLDRPDLQAAFGPPVRLNAAALLGWTAQTGATVDWQNATLRPFAAVYRHLAAELGNLPCMTARQELQPTKGASALGFGVPKGGAGVE